MSRAKGRMVRLQRLKLRLLSEERVHFSDLVREMGVSEATVWRDLQELGATSPARGWWVLALSDADRALVEAINRRNH